MMVSSTNCPRLRPHVRRTQAPHAVYLEDALGLCAEPERLTLVEAAWLDLLDGERTLADIHRATGARLPLETLARWVERLDERLLLDSPQFRRIVDGPLRPA